MNEGSVISSQRQECQGCVEMMTEARHEEGTKHEL